jgi:hypothetical protein
MLVTLLPGAETTFHIATDQLLDPEALTAYPVLYTRLRRVIHVISHYPAIHQRKWNQLSRR